MIAGVITSTGAVVTHHLDAVTGEIVDAAVQLHKRLGPGLLESIYETVLARELRRRGLALEQQVALDFVFDGVLFRKALRIDMLVEDHVVVELKSTERLERVHLKQVLTYLRLADLPIGLLLNFGAATMKEGLHRIVNSYPHARSSPPSTRPTSPEHAPGPRSSTSPGESPPP